MQKFVAVVGRPNAGKSTLINALAGRKAAIVSRKRQTTRGVVRAQVTHNGANILFCDTPGWQARYGDSFSRALNAGAEQTASNAAVVVYVVEALVWHDEDDDLMLRMPPDAVLIVAANKTDTLGKDRDLLLPFMAEINRRHLPRAIVPVSALKKRGLTPLLDEVINALPEKKQAPVKEHKEDAEFLFAEALREKLFVGLGGELPYRAGVIAHCPPRKGKTMQVAADIYVEKESQKAIVIGAGGAALKKIATAARRDMEKIAGEKICLTVRVRARKWRQDGELLAQMRIGARAA